MKFRCRKTGNILTERQVKKSRTKFWSWESQPWSQKTLDLAEIDPVVELPKPEHDSFMLHVEQFIVEREGVWYQDWLEVANHPEPEQLKAAVIQQIRAKASQKRAEGITVDGVSYGTTPDKIALLRTAVDSGASVDMVAGNVVHKLSPEQVKAAYQAVVAHVQSLYSQEAALIASAPDCDWRSW